jgi:hypothetical protein
MILITDAELRETEDKRKTMKLFLANPNPFFLLLLFSYFVP